MAEILFSRRTEKMKQSWSKINIWTITVPKNIQENKNKKQKPATFPIYHKNSTTSYNIIIQTMKKELIKCQGKSDKFCTRFN